MTKMQIKANTIFVCKNKIPVWIKNWNSATTLNLYCAAVSGPHANDHSLRQLHNDAPPGTDAERSAWEEIQEGHRAVSNYMTGCHRKEGFDLLYFVLFLGLCACPEDKIR